MFADEISGGSTKSRARLWLNPRELSGPVGWRRIKNLEDIRSNYSQFFYDKVPRTSTNQKQGSQKLCNVFKRFKVRCGTRHKTELQDMSRKYLSKNYAASG